MILNNSQAEAVYCAMCALNNVGALLNIQRQWDDRAGWGVSQYKQSHNTVVVFAFGVDGQTTCSESYADQTAFATAYDFH